MGVKSAGGLRPRFKASPTEKKKVGSPDVLCCFRYRVRVCSASAEEGQNDFYIVAGCGKATPSPEFKTESRARGTMWLALLPPARH